VSALHASGTFELTQETTVWHLTLHGEHDLVTVPELEQAMQTVLGSGTTVVIDLTDATFIDSSVINWLVSWSQAARQPDSMLTLAIVDGADSFAGRVIDLIGARDHLPVYPTRQDALLALG
jgi:anti-anti-sigma factor